MRRAGVRWLLRVGRHALDAGEIPRPSPHVSDEQWQREVEVKAFPWLASLPVATQAKLLADRDPELRVLVLRAIGREHSHAD